MLWSHIFSISLMKFCSFGYLFWLHLLILNQYKGNNSCTTDAILTKLHVHQCIMVIYIHFNSILLSILSKTLEGRQGTTDEFTTTPLHLCLFSAALVELAESIPVTFWYCLPTSSSVCLYSVFLSLCPVGLSLLNQKTLKHSQIILASWPGSGVLHIYFPMAAWILALFVISLVFSALISILYLVQVLLRLSTRASKLLLSLS